VSQIVCCNCGIEFGVPDEWETNRRRDHQSFWCPNGHAQSYVVKSDVEKLRDELEQERRNSLNTREKLAAAERAQGRAEKSLERHKKRSAAGVCPCCNRTVKQLAQHMASKHADFQQLQGITARKALPPKKDSEVLQ
jgi:hypothetical protein